MVGKLIGKRYRIGEPLGGGGMAVVYQAQDLQLGRDVAVKVLRDQFASDQDFIRRFHREAQNAASLSHPNVVRIYDVGQGNQLYYIVLELVEGNSLKEVIRQRKGEPLPVTEACQIAIEILKALSHAHSHKIVHRDIKPHNILIAHDGGVKVTDFGIAQVTTTDTVTRTGSIMGSAHYLSPEQANGQVTDDKSDLYSLGVVLYEMLTGTVPFQAESPITVALKHLREQPLAPSLRNSKVPRELDEIILQALEKEPNDRYPSADAMRQALERFIAEHAAGKTHLNTTDFPTMDLRAGKHTKSHRDRPERDERWRQENALPPTVQPRSSKVWVWVLAVILLVAAGIGAGAWALINFLDVPEVTVPDVKGLPLVRAQSKLTEGHLDFIIQSEQFSDLEVNWVISTDPPAGTLVKQGKRIALVISKGRESKSLPDVRGRTEEEARAQLESERFVIGRVDRRVDQAAEGTVIEMVPSPGISLKVGSTINLILSSGPLRVPPILGKSLQDAQKALIEAGLRPGKLAYRPDLASAKDTVLSSDPPPGTRILEGQEVNLILSQGAAASEARAFEKSFTVPGQENRWYEVRVMLVQTVGGTPNERGPLFNEKRQGGAKVTIKDTFIGEAYLRIMIDNTEIQRIPLP